MNRRDFLALVAVAPIAALAPLPYFLPVPTIVYAPYAGNQVALYDGQRWRYERL